MRLKSLLIGLLSVWLSLTSLQYHPTYGDTKAFFSPAPFTQESIRDQIIKHINLSKKSIDIEGKHQHEKHV